MATILQLFVTSLASAVALDLFAENYTLGKVTGTCVFFVTLLLPHLVYRYVIWPKFFSPLRHLPKAPGSQPLIGHMKQIVKESSGFPMRRWIESVPNNGMIRYSMWLQDRVLITQPSLLAEVLVTKNYDFIKPSHVRALLQRLLGVGILLAEGEEHKAQRKTLMPAFAFRHVKNLYPVFWSKSRELVECLSKASDPENWSPDVEHDPERKHKRGSIEVSKWASRATLDIIGISGMGRDFDALHNPNNELHSAYKQIFSRANGIQFALQLMSLFIPRWIVDRIPIKYNIELDKSVNLVRETCRDLVAQKRRSLEKGEKTDIDILSVALEAGGFTDSQLVDQMMTFLAAGHDTTATAMTAAMVLLSRDQRVQTKLREEIRAQIPSPSNEISTADIDDCQYLQAVCSEILRIWSPVSMTFRIANRDTTIGGEFVPKGTTMTLCPWAVNASTELWGDDAHEFKPERWLDASGKANHQGSASSNYSFLTFLHGPRSCIGQRFAQSEFACLLAAWVGTFETNFEEGSPLFKGDGKMTGGITNKPKEGVWCSLRKVPGWE